jgi:hypothetical protein
VRKASALHIFLSRSKKNYMKITTSLAATMAAVLFLFVFDSHAQSIPQTSLYIGDGSGHLTALTAPTGPGIFLFPSGGGTVLTTATGLINPMSAAGQMIYGGVSGAPTLLPIAATNGSILSYNTATNVPGWIASLPIANGGTGAVSASAAFNALSPMTTLGDIEYESGANTASRLAGNTTLTKKFLTQTGAVGPVSAAPAWGTIAAGDVPTFVASGTSHAAGAVPDPGATAGTTRYLREDAQWVAPSNTAVMITGFSNGFNANSATYTYPMGSTSASTSTTADVADGDVMVVNRNGTIKNLTVTLGSTPNSGKTYTFTIYDNGSTTGITVSLTNSTGASLSDNSDTHSVSPGDLLSIKYSGLGNPPPMNAAWAFDIQ